METQDVKVGRINNLKRAMPLDQTALFLLAHKLSAGSDERTKLSKDQADRIEKLLSRMLEELVAIKGMLAASRGEQCNDDSKANE